MTNFSHSKGENGSISKMSSGEIGHAEVKGEEGLLWWRPGIFIGNEDLCGWKKYEEDAVFGLSIYRRKGAQNPSEDFSIPRSDKLSECHTRMGPSSVSGVRKRSEVLRTALNAVGPLTNGQRSQLKKRGWNGRMWSTPASSYTQGDDSSGMSLWNEPG
ncbi:hypothetical protein B0H11DRAFT_2189954 [Mycena galericulata]|nr:hypothetical protein B0H11DRAFT_2189954 [Mycena galericulata]